MSILSGTTGHVKIGSTSYAFDKWKLAIKAGAPNVTNFTSSGYKQIVSGVIAGTLTISGPYNQGSMAFSVNTTYTWLLGLDTGVELSVSAKLTSLEVDNNVEDSPRVSIGAETSGSFTSSIT
jgi:hypothetical protein